jgi:hypothetical protein
MRQFSETAGSDYFNWYQLKQGCLSLQMRNKSFTIDEGSILSGDELN